MRAFLWTMLALQAIAALSNALQVWAPRATARSETYVRRMALVGLAISTGMLLWVVNLL